MKSWVWITLCLTTGGIFYGFGYLDGQEAEVVLLESEIIRPGPVPPVCTPVGI